MTISNLIQLVVDVYLAYPMIGVTLAGIAIVVFIIRSYFVEGELEARDVSFAVVAGSLVGLAWPGFLVFAFFNGIWEGLRLLYKYVFFPMCRFIAWSVNITLDKIFD